MTPEEETRFRALLSESAEAAAAALDAALPPAGDDPAGVLAAAMRRGALAGGKRLRAFLTLRTAEMLGAAGDGPARAAAAVECLHAYSLIHDDLPCMDDDDLRRGLPTVHVEWGEDVAVLAGDALQTLAFELLTDPATHEDGAVRAELALSLARASGQAGMVLGQMLDIKAEEAQTPLDLPAIERLQALKTGALIACAADLGALLGGADAVQRAAIAAYARDLGSAFQIQDDVLDVTGDEAETGKALRKDAAAGKATFVDLLGLEGARARAEAHMRSACEALAPFGPAAAPLKLAAAFTISRRS